LPSRPIPLPGDGVGDVPVHDTGKKWAVIWPSHFDIEIAEGELPSLKSGCDEWRREHRRQVRGGAGHRCRDILARRGRVRAQRELPLRTRRHDEVTGWQVLRDDAAPIHRAAKLLSEGLSAVPCVRAGDAGSGHEGDGIATVVPRLAIRVGDGRSDARSLAECWRDEDKPKEESLHIHGAAQKITLVKLGLGSTAFPVKVGCETVPVRVACVPVNAGAEFVPAGVKLAVPFVPTGVKVCVCVAMLEPVKVSAGTVRFGAVALQAVVEPVPAAMLVAAQFPLVAVAPFVPAGVPALVADVVP
jgi:hypothetical protein